MVCFSEKVYFQEEHIFRKNIFPEGTFFGRITFWGEADIQEMQRKTPQARFRFRRPAERRNHGGTQQCAECVHEQAGQDAVRAGVLSGREASGELEI